MNNHSFRDLAIAFALIGLALLADAFMGPPDGDAP
jgi:hypothetical protein